MFKVGDRIRYITEGWKYTGIVVHTRKLILSESECFIVWDDKTANNNWFAESHLIKVNDYNNILKEML